MQQFIQSKENPKLKHLRGLIEQPSTRKKHAQTILEGAHLIESYLNSKQQPQSVFITETGLQHPENQIALTQINCPVFILPEQIYKSLSTLTQATPLMAIIQQPESDAHWKSTLDTLILDHIQDPGNVGTLLRSAAAVGVRQIIATKGTASLWSPRVLRAAMGAHFTLNLFENADYHDILNTFNIPILATSSHRPTSIYNIDLTQPLVWILGNEGQGVHPVLLEQAKAVTIPQPGGQESLNVAIAGSVCLFEMMRQRLLK
ncbi:RNA methyltransferase [Acinetobacter qingfengensis]|uniref:rRNA methyltransferase n=1 Tax=Acinetobacter qingfengensis TaxID=1262585 RepID=A0A1E7RFT6_9GAMM|nr:RNA methyltransferase [Acinetobacter qingfengensis]KAA8732723.1 RNA methyltransferase [Acinetobacter qingfengensis]OEY98163.1 rRNA methyltransferase [Acinetobacter qingfengensis]